MGALAFDARKAVRAFQEAGFDEVRAEAVVATVGDAVGGNVAAKSDIAELRAEIAALKADIYRLAPVSAIAVIGFTAALTVALSKLL